MRAAIEIAARQSDRKLIFVVVGERGPSEAIAGGEIRLVPFLQVPQEMARYYAAADIYLQGSLADTFPNTVLEAMACGLPVVATRVGGVPEQVAHGKTGHLVPVGRAAEMAEAISALIGNKDMRCAMGASAVARVRAQFDLERQIQTYLDYYREILATHPARRPAQGVREAQGLV
jgi:glycosyltransferase involved in cell wall biosynthesis